MPELEKYSILWQECGKDSHIAKRFFVPEYEGYLPFLVSGDDLEDLEQKRDVELQESHLLFGILYGLYESDHHPKPWTQKQDRETLLYLLDVLMGGFKFESPEKMILDVASKLRERNGSQVSRVVLEVGKGLMPQSSKIKSDLIIDLWACVDNDRDVFVKEILELLDQIDLEDVHSSARELVCYYGLCATVFLGKEEDGITQYLEKHIYPNVTNDLLKQNIKALLERPEAFTPLDLEVT